MGEPKPLLAQTDAKPISYDDNPIELPLWVNIVPTVRVAVSVARHSGYVCFWECAC